MKTSHFQFELVNSKVWYHQNRVVAKSKNLLFICRKLFTFWPIIWISVLLLPLQMLSHSGNFLSGSPHQALSCKTQDKYHRVDLLCPHLSFHLDITVTQQPNERSLSVSQVGQYRSRSPVHIATCSEKPKANVHYIKIDPQCTNTVFPSWDACLCTEQAVCFGMGQNWCIFWVSDILLKSRSSKWHIHSYCYPRLNRLILQRTSICSWIYGTSIFSVLCSAKMDLDIIVCCSKLQHNFCCL